MPLAPLSEHHLSRQTVEWSDEMVVPRFFVRKPERPRTGLGRPGSRGWWLVPLLGVTVAYGACAGDRPQATRSRSDRSGPPAPSAKACPSEPIEPRPLTLSDGTEIYIEPETVAVSGSTVLVAGSPTYAWDVGSATNAVLLSRDALLAAYVEPGEATVIDRPVDFEVGDVRVAAMDDGRWAVLLSELDPDSLPLKSRVRGVWYGEHDGERWRVLDRIPLPTQGRLETHSSSVLLRAGEALSWAAVVRLPGGQAKVLYYERRNGEWHSEVVVDARVEVTALGYAPASGLWLALVSPDPDVAGARNSLRLYHRTSSWELVRRVMVADVGASIRQPLVTVLPAGVTVTWLSVGLGESRASAMVDIGPDGGGTRLLLDSSAGQVAPLEMGDGRPSWLVDHVNPVTQQHELRLLRGTPQGVSLLWAVRNPYSGFFAAIPTTRSEVFVVGPEFNPDPAHPTVRSVILRLSTSCT